MRAAPAGSRRLGGGHITLIIVALCATLAPAAVHAADRVFNVIADPRDGSALARVSEDGRLGVRGETTSQQGVPANEWHRGAAAGRLLMSAPPGSGIGVSQFTVDNYGRERDGFVWVWLEWARAAGECPPDDASLPTTRLYEALVPIPADEPVRTEQFLFPVPLTVRAAAKQSTCLYAGADSRNHLLRANGVTGPMTPAFEAPAGTGTPPNGEVPGQPADEVQP